jgi:hypothetical protein
MNDSRRVLAGFSVLVVMLMIAGAASFVRYARRHAPNLQLFAVAPFDIFVPGLEPWRVRLAEDLTDQLRTVPPLSAVPQSVVRERWRGAERSEVAALELAQRTSAGAAVYGRVDSLGDIRDSVRVQVIVIDARSGRVLFGLIRRWPRADLRGAGAALAQQIRQNYRYPGD